jgi:hypothetical protein
MLVVPLSGSVREQFLEIGRFAPGLQFLRALPGRIHQRAL